MLSVHLTALRKVKFRVPLNEGLEFFHDYVLVSGVSCSYCQLIVCATVETKVTIYTFLINSMFHREK